MLYLIASSINIHSRYVACDKASQIVEMEAQQICALPNCLLLHSTSNMAKCFATSADRKRKRQPVYKYDFWETAPGARLSHARLHGDRLELPSGCGVATLSGTYLFALQGMFLKMRDSTPRSVAWGDGSRDNKERSYAMLPNESLYKDVEDITYRGIMFYDIDSGLSADQAVRNAAIRKHRMTKEKAFIYADCTAPEKEAIEAVVKMSRDIVDRCDLANPLQPYEKASVSLQNLVAIQLNVHNKDDFLPLHLDNARFDGFGVVIVTLALYGSADVVIVDDGDIEQGQAEQGSKSWAFVLHPGQLYVLSGHARNKCSHGVVVLTDQASNSSGDTAPLTAQVDMVPPPLRRRIAKLGRVSLSFRFGLHTAEQAAEDIDRHWA